jgi:putative ABC transport system permease protein
MLKQFRSHSFFSLIMLISLSIGFSVCSVLFSLLLNDLGYDRCWKGEDQLYRIAMEQYQDGDLSFRSTRTYRGLPGMLVEELPEVSDMTRLMPDVITVFVGEQQIQDVRMFYADTNVFKVLPRKILAAESPRVFPDIHSMAISASMAKTLYGTVDCLGEKLRLNEGWTFYISTVFEDIPEKSHLDFDVLLTRASLIYYMRNFDNVSGQLVDNEEFDYVDPGPYHPGSWNNFRSYNYVRVHKGADLVHLQQKAVELIGKVELPDRIKEATILPYFQAVEGIHLHSDYPDEVKENSSIFYIYMLLLISLVVLLVCWINFINIFAVVFNERARVLAIRMIHGASFRGITFETIVTVCLISMLAAILAVGLSFLVESFSSSFLFDARVVLIQLALVFLTSLLSLLIPLTSFRPGRIMNKLKGEVFGKRRGSTYRRIMVTVQFSSGVVLIASTLVIWSQMKYAAGRDLGFDDRNIIYSFSPMTMNQRPDIPQKLIMFRNEMKAIPGVEAFCTSSTVPGRSVHFPGTNLKSIQGDTEREAFVQRVNVDQSYFDLYQIKLLAGRDFRDNEHYDQDEVVLNSQACVDLGFSDPSDALGTMIQLGENQWTVIGVVENYHHLSLKDKLQPMVFFKSLRWRAAVGYYSFRLNSTDRETIERIAAVWKRTYPGEQFLYNYMEESYQNQYEAERSFGTSFLIAALLAILTSCLGLLGLSRFNILKRTKEIGIRKTFGSSSALILKRLQSETVFLVMLAALIGIPLAWFISKRWLENFHYRINPAWWMFLLAFLLVLLVAISTTFVQTWRASLKNPVDALRYE